MRKMARTGWVGSAVMLVLKATMDAAAASAMTMRWRLVEVLRERVCAYR